MTGKQKQKRMGKESSPGREALLEAAERLMRREGYASVIARRVAEEAGLKKQLVFYYFKSMDDLIGELFNRWGTGHGEMMEKAFTSEDPLGTLWLLHTKGDATLLNEFMAMARHNESLREKLIGESMRNKAIQTMALPPLLERLGIDPAICPPKVALFIFASVARNYLVDKELGLLDCGEELTDFLAWCRQRIG